MPEDGHPSIHSFVHLVYAGSTRFIFSSPPKPNEVTHPEIIAFRLSKQANKQKKTTNKNNKQKQENKQTKDPWVASSYQ